jgi:large subunit ribosomal protein L4
MPTLKHVSGGGELQVSDAAFGQQFNESLVHQVITAYRNAGRAGTKAQKTRAEVRGGGKKPWSQKGTGQARAGSSRSPIWVGGGTVFGPQPRNYTFKVNRKERKAALRSALSLHAERESLAVLDPAPYIDTPSTKDAAVLLANWNQPRGGILVVLTDDESQASLSFRNLKRVSVLPATAVGIADLIGATAVLASRAALDQLTERATK